MSKPTDLPGLLVYAPKWARDAAIAERFDAASRPVAGEALWTDDAWPTEWSPTPRSLDPVILPPPPSRSRRGIRFAFVGGLAISAAVGSIMTLVVLEKMPLFGLVAKGDRLSTSFEARFTGPHVQNSSFDLFSDTSQLARIKIASQWENQEAHLEPVTGADHASSTATDMASAAAPANQKPPLAAAMGEATADQASRRTTDGAAPSALRSEEPRLGESLPHTTADQASSRTADGAAPSALVGEEARPAEQPRQASADQSSSSATDGSSSKLATQEPRLVEPLPQATADDTSSSATDGAAPSALSSEQRRLDEPLPQAIADQASSRTAGGAAPSGLVGEEPRLAEPPTVGHVTEPTSPSLRALPPDEISAFLKRGQQLVASGDIAAARLLLLRAAEARDAKSALALAETFDPIILERRRAYGVAPDVTSARRWYEKAKELGSVEASPRLEMLARREADHATR